MLGREQAFELLKKYLRNNNLIKHSIAVETILKDMAKKLHENEENWGLAGLLHDLDYDYSKQNPEKHAILTTQVLEGLVPKEVIDAIKAHNYKHTMKDPVTTLDKSLIAADAVSGLVIATALVMPSKKLADVELKTLINKYNDKSFAQGCNRKKIELAEDIGLDVNSFLELSLTALKKKADSLGV
jgi:hypothetical protein